MICRRDFLIFLKYYNKFPEIYQQKFWEISELTKKVKKGKGRYSSSWETRLRATGRYLPYGITQCCYLPPDTSERLAPAMQAGTRFTYPGGMEA